MVNLRTQLLYNLNVLSNNSQTKPTTPQLQQQQQQQQQQTNLHHNSTSSIRLLAGQLANTASTSAISSPQSAMQSALVSSFGGTSLNQQQQPASPTLTQQQLQSVQSSITFFQSNPNLVNSSVLHAALTTNQQPQITTTANGSQNVPIQQISQIFMPVSLF